MSRLFVLAVLLLAATTAAQADSYVSNMLVDIRLSGSGNFGMGTTGGDPADPSDNDKKMIYQWPSYSSTTFSSWYVNGATGYFGDWLNGTITEFDRVSIPGSQLRMTYLAREIEMVNTVTLTDEITGRFDTAEITYHLTNRGMLTKDVGFRIMLDTMIGGNDGAPINVAGNPFSLYENEWGPLRMPQYWYAFEYDIANPGLTAQGTIRGYSATTPDRFAVGYWPGVNGTVWNYNVNPGQQYAYAGGGGDSCTVMWYGPRPLNAGETWTITTYYGLVSLSTCDEAMQVLLVAPATFKNSCMGEAPWQASMQIHNAQTTALMDLQAVLLLDYGMEFYPSGLRRDQVRFPPLPPGQTLNHTWDIRLNSLAAGLLGMDLYVTASPNVRCVADRTVDVRTLMPCTPTPAGETPTATPTPGAATPTSTPTPGGDTPTSTPTPGPGTPTATPTPSGGQPLLLAGGYMTTRLTPAGGAMLLMAVDGVLVGQAPGVSCALYYGGVDTGIRLTPAGAGVFSGQFGLGAGLAPGSRFRLEMLLRDAGGRESGLWPYLNVGP
jgi:hypothetical protein